MIAVALILNAALLVAAFLAGLGVGHGSRRRSLLVCSGGILLCLAKGFLARRPDIETRLFPWPDYVLYSGWNGPLAMLVVGAMGALVRRRREWVFLTLAGLATVVYFGDFLFWVSGATGANADIGGSRWRPPARLGPSAGAEQPAEEVVLRLSRRDEFLCPQTTDYSCGAAAAASMLRLVGVMADEGEMAALCLTREGRGTLDLGLYRGLNLRLRQANAGLGVRIERLTFDDLKGVTKPCILRVRLGGDHMVVVLGMAGERAIVFDPSAPNMRLAWDRQWLTEAADWGGLAFVLYPLRPTDRSPDRGLAPLWSSQARRPSPQIQAAVGILHA